MKKDEHFQDKKTSLSLAIYHIQPLHCRVFFGATLVLAAIMSQYAYLIAALSFNLHPKAKASLRHLKQNIVPKSLSSWKNTEMIQRQSRKTRLLRSSPHSNLLILSLYYFILDMLCLITSCQRSNHIFWNDQRKLVSIFFIVFLWLEKCVEQSLALDVLPKLFFLVVQLLFYSVLQLFSHRRQHVHNIVERSAVTGYYLYEFYINCGLAWCGSGLAISLLQKTNNKKRQIINNERIPDLGLRKVMRTKRTSQHQIALSSTLDLSFQIYFQQKVLSTRMLLSVLKTIANNEWKTGTIQCYSWN